MNITDALKSEDIRITNGQKKWMVYDKLSQSWNVYERIKGRSICLIDVPDEDRAIEILLKDNIE